MNLNLFRQRSVEPKQQTVKLSGATSPFGRVALLLLAAVISLHVVAARIPAFPEGYREFDCPVCANAGLKNRCVEVASYRCSIPECEVAVGTEVFCAGGCHWMVDYRRDGKTVSHPVTKLRGRGRFDIVKWKAERDRLSRETPAPTERRRP